MNTLKWTNEVLKSFNPCPEGYQWYVDNCLSRDIEDTETIIGMLMDEGTENTLSWAIWTVVRALDRKNRIKFAVFAAEQVIHIYEKKYPEDDRPRKAIEAAKLCIENDTEDNRRAARASYDAAYDTAAYDTAAYAAYAAASAAYDAADSAAYAAADAAAYDAASKKEMQIKILNYGVELLGEK